jgi:hypothetical protein
MVSISQKTMLRPGPHVEQHVRTGPIDLSEVAPLLEDFLQVRDSLAPASGDGGVKSQFSVSAKIATQMNGTRSYIGGSLSA